jgi:hypothetical protein
VQPRTLRQAIERDPFIAMRLHLANGKKLIVRHARAACRLPYGLLVFRGYRTGRARVSGYDVIHYRLIKRIEQLEARRRNENLRRSA